MSKETKTVQVALYRFRGYLNDNVEEHSEYKDKDETYTRVSEITEIEFTILENANEAQVKNIRTQMKEEQAKAHLIQQELQDQINSLLALPNLA